MSEIDSDAVDASLPWQDQLRSLALAFLATLMAHPNAAPLIAERSLRTAGSLRVAEKALRIMTDAGAQLADAVATIDAIGLLASGIAQVASASAGQADGAAGNSFAGFRRRSSRFWPRRRKRKRPRTGVPTCCASLSTA